MQFLLNAYAAATGVRQSGKRVAPQDWRRVRSRTEPHHHELTGQRNGQGKAIRRLQRQRNHAAALANYSGHFKRPEAGRGCGQLFRGRQARVSRLRPRLFHLAKKSFKRTFPAGTESRDLHDPLNVSLGRPGKIEQRVDRRDSHALRTLCHSDNFIAGAHLALFEHTEIEPGALMRHEQGRHPGLIHAYADTVARHARLGDFEQRSADPIAVADAHLAVGQALDGKILSELSEAEIISLQFTFPIVIRIHLVDENGAMLSTVTMQVALRIAVNVEAPDHALSHDRVLPYGRVDDLPAPCNLAGKADVD